MLTISFTLVGIAAVALTAMFWAVLIFSITMIEMEPLLDLLVIEDSDATRFTS